MILLVETYLKLAKQGSAQSLLYFGAAQTEQIRGEHFNDTSINARIRSTTNASDAAYLRSDGGNIAAFLYQMRENQEYIPYYERIIRHIRMILPQFYDFVLEPDGNGYLPLNWKQEGSEEVVGLRCIYYYNVRFFLDSK